MTIIFCKDGEGTRLPFFKTGRRSARLSVRSARFPAESLEQGKTALLVGGGIGVPPLYELSKRLTNRGVHAIHVLAFCFCKSVFYEQEFSRFGRVYRGNRRRHRGSERDLLQMSLKTRGFSLTA